MEKTIKKWLYAIVMIFLAISFTACPDTEPEGPEVPEYPNYPGGSGNTTNGGGSGNNNGNNGGNNNSNGGETQIDVLNTLLKHVTWYKSTSNNDIAFTFKDGNKINFLEAKWSGNKQYLLTAEGTFSLSGYTIKAFYDDIDLDPDNQVCFNKFPDWPHKGTRSVTYTILSISDNCLVITDGKTTWTLDKTLM